MKSMDPETREDFRSIVRAGIAFIPISLLTGHFLYHSLYLTLLSLCAGFTGIGIDFLYGVVFRIENNVAGITWWEHFSWGQLFIILSTLVPFAPPLFGPGLYLSVAELFQRHPFSYGETDFFQTVAVQLCMFTLAVLSLLT